MKAFITPPIAVAFRDGGTTRSTEISCVRLCPLEEGREGPSAGMIANCEKKLRDREGNPISREVLAGMDLEGGLRAAMREALDFVGFH